MEFDGIVIHISKIPWLFAAQNGQKTLTSQ